MTAFKPLRRVMVGMDLSQMDFPLIDTLAYLHQARHMEQIYLVHVSSHLEVPAYAQALIGGLVPVSIDQQLKELLQERLNMRLPRLAFPLQIDVLEGDVTEQLLHWIRVKEVDLIILGKKAREKGSGLAVRRLLRQAPCSVLFVPEQGPGSWRNILIPTDFSPQAEQAFEAALNLSQGLPTKPVLHLVHVYDVPSTPYFELGRSTAQFAAEIEEQAHQQLAQTLARFSLQDQPVQTHLVQNRHHNVAWQLKETARRLAADLLMVGACGRSALATFLLGSVSEKLAGMAMDLPLWVLRPPAK